MKIHEQFLGPGQSQRGCNRIAFWKGREGGKASPQKSPIFSPGLTSILSLPPSSGRVCSGANGSSSRSARKNRDSQPCCWSGCLEDVVRNDEEGVHFGVTNRREAWRQKLVTKKM